MEEEKYTAPRTAEEAVFQQLEYTRKQYRISCITAVAACVTAVMVTVTSCWFISHFRGVTENLSITAKNLQQITDDLSEVDLSEAVEQFEHTARVSEEGIDTAMEKINAIDIDGLNQSIQDLHDTITPLKNLLGMFGGRS